MDLDKPLDDLITDSRKSKGGGNANNRGRGGGAPRQQRERSGPIPYARPPPRSTEEKWVHDAYQGPGGGRGGRREGRGGFGGDVSRISGTGAGFTGLSPRIEVIGLHYEVTPQDLKTIFSQAGTLVQGPTIRLPTAFPLQYDISGRSKGEATMEFASPQQAKIAINKFDGAMTKGQTIKISLLPPVVPRGGPANRGNGPANGGSLLSRIQGANTPANRGAFTGAPRGRGAPRGGPGGPRGRGGPGGARGGRRPAASGDDLDKDLDSFMSGGGDSGKAADDVDMS